mmetsp:Transcript_30373/g.70883  ORF Transcript_30373/g.70883 Transcript_30373/m.70883 type:complete len:114 (+) Transcript_30373:53-394(+)
MGSFLASQPKLWLDLVAGVQLFFNPLARAVTKFGDQAVEVRVARNGYLLRSKRSGTRFEARRFKRQRSVGHSGEVGNKAVEVGNRAVNMATIVTLFSVIFFGAIKVYEIQQRA